MRSRIDVAQVLRRLGIAGKRRGPWIEARCPSPKHPDKNPSWRIHTREGNHTCFSCGFKGGGVVSLVMEVLGVDAPEAREWLKGQDVAREADLDVRVEVGEVQARREFALPYGVHVGPLASWPGPARDYASSRGITVAQVERWGLGYAVDGKLAGRVVFPTRDRQGRLVGYSARSFTGARKRYLMPLASEGAVSGAVFGEQHARDGTVLVVTEGAIDALAVEREVPEYSVAAIYGSNISPGHLNRLHQKFLGILVATDSDAAGTRVAEEIRSALGRWTRVRRWVPPDGWDCAKLAVERPGELRAGLGAAWIAE